MPIIVKTPNHEQLLGLQGGSTNDHSHLTSGQLISLTSGSSTTLHAHDIYSLADGTRDFTGIVQYNAHKSFTADEDIIDKKYVDDEIAGLTTNHEELTGLLGGGAGDHYHLTSVQQTALTSGANTTLHKHDIYSLADGTRDFSGIVGYDTDKTFTDDKDIVAKKYVDDAIGALTTNHEELTGLLGGSVGNHYHLTSAQQTGLTSGASTTLHAHDIYLLADGSRDITGIIEYDSHKTFVDDTDIPDKKYVDDAIAGFSSEHNELTGLQGGDASNRFHLTASQHEGLTSGNATTLHQHTIDSLQISGSILPYHLNDTNDPTSGQVASYNPATGTFTWIDPYTNAGIAQDQTFTTTTALTYSLDFSPAREANLAVWANGITVYPADYTLNGNQITFVSGAIQSGDNIFVKSFQSLNNFSLNPTYGTFTGVTGTYTYDIGYSPVSESSLIVTINGVVSHPDDYTLSGTNLTFTSGVIETGDVGVAYNVSTCTTVEGAQASITDYTFTVTNGVYDYTLPVTPVNERSLSVSVNGAVVHPDDYTLSQATLSFVSGTIEANDQAFVKVIDPVVVGYDFDEAPMDGTPYVRQDGAWVSYIDVAYPIGSTYEQYPIDVTGTKSTDLPTSQAPATKFGGTWTLINDTEGLFFKTEGDPLTQTDGENNNRKTGLQTDAGQGHVHGMNATGVGTNGGAPQGATPSNDPTHVCYGPLDDGANGTPRTGKETRPRNRLFRVWKRTA